MTTSSLALPCDLAAERAVLGAALLEPSTLALIRTLRPEDFLHDGNRLTFTAIVALCERGDPVDVIMVTAELRQRDVLDLAGGPAHLAVCMEEAALSTGVEAYARLIRECATKRRLVELGHTVEAWARDGRPSTEILADVKRSLTDLRTSSSAAWPLHDGAEAWTFPAVTELIEHILPAAGVVWWGGLPKRYKSLFALYCALAIACHRSQIVKKFLVRTFPKILYVAREDSGARLQGRKQDILSAWIERPEPGAIVFVIRPALDLLNPEHVGWLRDTCLQLGITMLVLDTWTALSPTADPLGPQDQAQLAAVVVKLAEDINGLVIVVDHSRKNRPEGQPLSSADIFGPPQKWAAAEHVVMLDVVEAGRRIEIFLEGKDLETRRFFLAVSPRGSGEEKFVYAGSAEDLATAQRAVGTKNRDAVLAGLQAASAAVSTSELVDLLTAAGAPMSPDTVQRHARALVAAGQARQTGQGRGSRYFALAESPQGPFAVNAGCGDE